MNVLHRTTIFAALLGIGIATTVFAEKPCSPFLNEAGTLLKKKKVKFKVISQRNKGTCEDNLSYSPGGRVLVVARLSIYKTETQANQQMKEYRALFSTPFGPEKDIRLNTANQVIAAFRLGGACHSRFIYKNKHKVFSYSFLNYPGPCQVKRTPGYLKTIDEAGKKATR